MTTEKEHRSGLADNILTSMSTILSPLATWLCKTPTEGGLNAAPTFQFWDYEKDGQKSDTAYDQLVALTNALPQEIVDDGFLKSVWQAIPSLTPLVAKH